MSANIYIWGITVFNIVFIRQLLDINGFTEEKKNCCAENAEWTKPIWQLKLLWEMIQISLFFAHKETASFVDF